MPTGLVVRDAPARSRYELLDGDRVVGFTEYQRRGDVLVLPHTVIPKHRRGRGYATRLIRDALDDVRRQGLRVVPECSFVAQFLTENPDYADLVGSLPRPSAADGAASP
jgi:uncharacterized protein